MPYEYCSRYFCRHWASFLQVGLGLHFWINILLTLLGYLPGIVHAVWVIVKFPEQRVTV